MILPVQIIGSPILRKKAAEIKKNDADLPEFIQDMWDTMYDSDGVGLAAPQVGKSIRLFVIDAQAMVEDEPELAGFKKVFINAQIIETSGDTYLFNEGCLSIPELREDVERKEKIKIRYFDENWIRHEEDFDGTKARIIQHEYDHLEGILFTDRLSAIRKTMLKSKLYSISKGNFTAKYKFKLGSK
jgi:peptide deformylase